MRTLRDRLRILPTNTSVREANTCIRKIGLPAFHPHLRSLMQLRRCHASPMLGVAIFCLGSYASDVTLVLVFLPRCVCVRGRACVRARVCVCVCVRVCACVFVCSFTPVLPRRWSRHAVPPWPSLHRRLRAIFSRYFSISKITQKADRLKNDFGSQVGRSSRSFCYNFSGILSLESSIFSMFSQTLFLYRISNDLSDKKRKNTQNEKVAFVL